MAHYGYSIACLSRWMGREHNARLEREVYEEMSCVTDNLGMIVYSGVFLIGGLESVGESAER